VKVTDKEISEIKTNSGPKTQIRLGEYSPIITIEYNATSTSASVQIIY
jgi:hypothetical protein